MPFEIRKQDTKYKVFSIGTDRPLSKKPLSYPQAKKQLIAVRINYRKKK